jgi:hypothetical protein
LELPQTAKRETRKKANSLTVKKSPPKVYNTKQSWKNEPFKENLLRLLSSCAFAFIRLVVVKKQAKEKDDEEWEGAEQFKAIKSSSRFESDSRTGRKGKQRKRRFIVGEEKSLLEPAPEGSRSYKPSSHPPSYDTFNIFSRFVPRFWAIAKPQFIVL